MENFFFILHPSDVTDILRLGLRQVQRYFSDIREKNGKDDNHLVTMDEFCDYFSLKPEDVRMALRNRKPPRTE